MSNRQAGFGETKAQDAFAGVCVMGLAAIPLLFGDWLGPWSDALFGTVWGLAFAFAMLGSHFVGFFMIAGRVFAWVAGIVAVLGLVSCMDRFQSRGALGAGFKELSASYAPDLAKGCGSGGHPLPAAVQAAAAKRAAAKSEYASAHDLVVGANGAPHLRITLGTLRNVGPDGRSAGPAARKHLPVGTVLTYEARCAPDSKDKLEWTLVQVNGMEPRLLPRPVRNLL